MLIVFFFLFCFVFLLLFEFSSYMGFKFRVIINFARIDFRRSLISLFFFSREKREIMYTNKKYNKADSCFCLSKYCFHSWSFKWTKSCKLPWLSWNDDIKGAESIFTGLWTAFWWLFIAGRQKSIPQMSTRIFKKPEFPAIYNTIDNFLNYKKERAHPHSVFVLAFSAR